jgi:hypothetical protein
MIMIRTLLLAAMAFVSGCATLGPVPATTGLPAVPEERLDATVQVGVVPGFYLSQSTTEDPKGAAIGAASIAIEPGRVVPGLVAGVRIFGPNEDTVGEPMLGYRHTLKGGALSLAGFAFATQSRAEQQSASYQATQGGGEGAVDFRVTRQSRWFEPHLIASLSLTAVSADGTYCQDSTDMHGVDCPKPPDPPTHVTTGSVSGAYPAGTAGIAIDLVRHHDSPFHGVRVAAMVAGGYMPHLAAGEQVSGTAYFSIGLAISISGGAGH